MPEVEIHLAFAGPVESWIDDLVDAENERRATAKPGAKDPVTRNMWLTARLNERISPFIEQATRLAAGATVQLPNGITLHPKKDATLEPLLSVSPTGVPFTVGRRLAERVERAVAFQAAAYGAARAAWENSPKDRQGPEPPAELPWTSPEEFVLRVLTDAVADAYNRLESDEIAVETGTVEPTPAPRPTAAAPPRPPPPR